MASTSATSSTSTATTASSTSTIAAVAVAVAVVVRTIPTPPTPSIRPHLPNRILDILLANHPIALDSRQTCNNYLLSPTSVTVNHSPSFCPRIDSTTDSTALSRPSLLHSRIRRRIAPSNSMPHVFGSGSGRYWDGKGVAVDTTPQPITISWMVRLTVTFSDSLREAKSTRAGARGPEREG